MGTNKNSWLRTTLRLGLFAAQRELNIVSLYFISGEVSTRQLSTLAEKGVQ